MCLRSARCCCRRLCRLRLELARRSRPQLVEACLALIVGLAQAVQCLRRFAAWVMGSAVAAIVAAPLLSVVLTLGDAPGKRQLVVGVGSDFPVTLLFAAIVWLMAAVIDQGQALADENAAFV